MKIYTKITWDIATGAIDSAEHFEYSGEVALCCGASSQQNAAQAAQANAYTQMTQQAQQIFGASSQVFQQLQNTFAPTVAAGPSQEGFSAAEKGNLQSQAITQSGVAARNAQQAVGQSIAAQGGGNNPALQSGVNTGINLSVANAAAANTANQLGQINEADYATGRQNYDTAVAGLAGAPNTFNPASTAGNAATGAGEASANTANQIASQNQSWVQAVTGALGGVAGSFVGGGLGKLIGGGSGATGPQINTGPSSVNTGDYIPQ